MPAFLRHFNIFRAPWPSLRAPIGQEELVELDKAVVLSARRGRDEEFTLATRWMSPDWAVFTTWSPLKEGDRVKLTLQLDCVSSIQIEAKVHWTTITQEGRVGRLELWPHRRDRVKVERFLQDRAARPAVDPEAS